MLLGTKDEEIKLCLEYSEKPEELKQLLKEIKVYIGEPRFMSYFEDDKEKNINRNVYTVTIKRNGLRISFKFGDSIINTQEGKQPELYDILACLQSDYFIPDNFKDFCSEFGYNEDSIKTKKLYKKCISQSQKLKAIFKDNEIEVMPRWNKIIIWFWTL